MSNISFTMIDFSLFNSLQDVAEYFSDELVCKQALTEARWGYDVVCPHCGRHHCVKRKDGRFRCNACFHNFSCLTGTIFENTKLPLKKWFMAMYLISAHKKGVSSLQVMRDCDVTQKTAWFMLHKIRSLFAQNTKALSGEVELDETYVGGRESNKHASKKTDGTQGRSTKTKTPVFGMQQRGGVVVALAVDDTKKATLYPIISRHISSGSTTYTDEANMYSTLDSEGYVHLSVNHSKGEYVRSKDIHTNGIEGFWAHFKRVVFGTYHCLRKSYLQRYVDEQSFRWNTRDWESSERFELMFRRSLGLFRYTDVLSLSNVVDVSEWYEKKARAYRVYAEERMCG